MLKHFFTVRTNAASAFDSPDTNSYLFNARSELTSATAAVDSDYRYGYNFDDIGNRTTSSERGTEMSYSANLLNQYTNIEYSAVSPATCYLSPIYDVDGNQTFVKTATGIWSVTYNGENRPVLWENVSTNSPPPNSSTPNSSTPPLISMSFDRMGRRVTKNEYIHFYLILWIARQVGYSSEDALSLAWGSQYPDTESWNAITWFFGPSIPKLHNLNGFSPSRVKKYRCCLVEQYAACIKKAKEISDNRERRRVLFECGVLLHVIGDTYAHTMSDGTAYLPVIGHLFDGTAPDNPYTDIIKFTRYVEDVFSAFPKDAGVTTSKDRLIRLMRDWDYCLDKELWFPKREYTEIVKELIKEVYPGVDYAKLKMSLQKSNKDRDSQMRNSILQVLDNCYKRSGR